MCLEMLHSLNLFHSVMHFAIRNPLISLIHVFEYATSSQTRRV